MTSSAILSLDQGTTSTKVLLVDATTLEVLASSTAPVRTMFPRPGWVEQDANDLWASIEDAVARCRGDLAVKVIGVAVSNQRESVVAWRASTGEAIGPVIGWQDSRTAQWCARLECHAETLRERTGLRLDPMYSASKMRWLIDRAMSDGVPAADIRVGTVDSWIVYRLTGEHAIEAGNASRTLLFDLERLSWDEELAELFGVPLGSLPQVTASAGGGRVLRPGVLGLEPVPVAAVLADSHAALFHHGRGRPGIVKASYGTGTSVMLPSVRPQHEDDRIADTLAWLDDGPRYAREGNVLTSGAGLDWMSGILCANSGVAADVGGRHLGELAASERDSGGVTFVPAFTGLGAPHWDRSAVGTLAGVTAGTTRGHIARAALEAVAHQVCDIVEAMELTSPTSLRVIADGGATRSDLLMQIQADLLGREVSVSSAPEASALGVAALASKVLTHQLPPAPEPRTAFLPGIGDTERGERRASWHAAVRRARGLAV